MISRIKALAILTFKEGVRDRALYGIGLFALVLMCASLIVVSLFMRELHKVSVDMNLSSITFAGLLMTFFISINLMAKDMDKHTIYCVMSKPYSRGEYITGKYLGIVFLLLFAFGILTLCSSIAVFITKIQFANWFRDFHWAGFYKAIYAEFLMLLVLNAVVMLFSTVTTSSFITHLFSICTYIAGQTIEEVVLYLKTQPDIVLTGPVNTIINVSQYLLPNLSVFDLKVKAAHTLPITINYLAGITFYGLSYSIVLLVLASLMMGRRELL